ncbi:nitroreductase, partial [Streptomyces sp. DSM 44917]|nr:nitroreductase [Streptomyces sp. DSM 44917]
MPATPPTPAAVPDADTVTALVTAATSAPSLHNAQPWRFHYHRESGALRLRAALDRALPHSDPHGRALHLGCAAALFNLRVAAADEGWRVPAALLPDPHDPRLLAVARLERTGGDQAGRSEIADLARLHPFLARRRSSRLPFGPERVPDPVREALRAAAEAEGAQLHLPSAWHVPSVLDQVHDAEGRDLADPGRAAELAEWTGPVAPGPGGPSAPSPAPA